MRIGKGDPRHFLGERKFIDYMLKFLSATGPKAVDEWVQGWERQRDRRIQSAWVNHAPPYLIEQFSNRLDPAMEWDPTIFMVEGEGRFREVQQQLRAYVDAWIDTGFHRDGSEVPWSRSFRAPSNYWMDPQRASSFPAFDTPAPIAAMALFLGAVPHPAAHGYALDFDKGALCVSPRIGGTGGIFYRVEPRSTEPGLEAARIFYWFYRSGLVFDLMRCNRCKVLEVPQRKSRNRYVRGWHCAKCRNIAGAESATAIRRREFKEKWFSLAVEAYRKYQIISLRDEMVRRITRRVNRELPYGSKIKRNTITRNLRKIRTAAEKEGNHAKG